MPRSFRFEPPEPRPGTLTRPRLLRALLRRWDHRVTVVVGGPGLGKTTLLAQAIAENRLAPRGDDVWLGVQAADGDGDTLARDAATAVARALPLAGPGTGDTGRPAARPGAAPGEDADPDAIADAMWRRAPTPVCVIFDDVHAVPPASPGAAWLAALADALPANGHLLFAGRTAPPIPLARWTTHGALLELSEDDLRFTAEELGAFAASRGVDARRLAGTGGWAAMAELAASVEGHRAADYVWEEVLEPLGPERRRVLSVVSDLGGADDALASDVLGRPVVVAEALDGVPLVARGSEGWRAPHPLWRSTGRLALGDDDRVAMRRRAAAHLAVRGQFDDAFRLAADAGEWDAAIAVLRAACLSGQRPTARQLDRWLADLPSAARATTVGQLAVGLRAAVASPATAARLLLHAARSAREAGDVDCEVNALALLGRVAWWHQDIALLGEIGPRIAELARGGEPLARALAALGRAVAADVVGDDAGVLRELAMIDPAVLDDTWRAVAQWLEAAVLVGNGEAARALEVLDGVGKVPDVAFERTIDALRLVAWWSLGRVDETIAALPELLRGMQAAGQAQNIMLGLANASLALAFLGDVEAARRYLDEAEAQAPSVGAPAVILTIARAALALAEGDEAAASGLLAERASASGLDWGSDRRPWRHALSLTYVLAPDTRPHWDGMQLKGHLATARSLAAAVVAVREGGSQRHLRELEPPPPDVIRALLHHRLSAELAVGLHRVGRTEAGPLLDALGAPGRRAVRDLASGRTPMAAAARALLAAVPAPPPQALELAVLGPLAVRRGDDEVTGGDLRRERVRELLAFLILHRKATRKAITAGLWPDLDERSGPNNLRVTLTYLLRLLEPDRAAGEPAYTVRIDGQDVRLVTGSALRIDVDEFEAHMLAARNAEAEGTPSVALDHLLAAVALYRGDLHADIPEADWLAFERDHYRRQFIAAAIRAGQLLVGMGDVDRAEAVARRAISADPWAEEAHAVLVAAALARSDRVGARRALERCESALAELGVAPSEEVRRLARQVRGA
jgi:ATP/maltotriose-dependent transcriptional regulator MalT/DNA-binding SARP family transcriptional activator